MSTDNRLSEQNNFIQELREDTLPETKRVVAQDNVVMNENGSLEYSGKNRKRDELRRRRKELVLGINGFEVHSLDEANDIISSERSSGLSRIREIFSRRKA